MVVFANVVSVAKGYFLVAVGVTANVGPVTTALVTALSSALVFWIVFRPSWRTIETAWATVLLMGVNMAVNNIAFQFVLRWVHLHVLAPLSFLCTAVFLMGSQVVRDARKRKYSTALWPVLALLGLWALLNRPGQEEGARAFTDAIPHIPILGLMVPEWALGVGAVILVSATAAFQSRWMEAYDKQTKGQVSTLVGFPALAAFAVLAWATEGGLAGMVGEHWPYLLICLGVGGVSALLNGVVVVKAYVDGLRASTMAMLSPMRTLLGVLLGMLVERVAPGPVGMVGIVVVLVASFGAARLQSREKPGTE